MNSLPATIHADEERPVWAGDTPKWAVESITDVENGISTDYGTEHNVNGFTAQLSESTTDENPVPRTEVYLHVIEDGGRQAMDFLASRIADVIAVLQQIKAEVE